MKRSRTPLPARHLLLAAVAFAPAALPAQDAVQSAVEPQPSGEQATLPPARKLNRLGLNLRLGFNVSASFKNKEAVRFSDPAPPGAGGGVDRFYDDGYVRPDETYPNNNGLTFFWGYQNESQAGPNDLFMHSSETLGPDDSKSSEDDLLIGGELTYTRELGLSRYGSWGFEAGIGFMPVDICDDDTVQGTVNVITDAFGLGDPPVELPAAPHSGTFNGVNLPVIEDTPNRRSIDPVAATASGERELEADLYTFRIGPYFSFPLSSRFEFQLGAGLAMAYINSDFRYSETLTTAANTRTSWSANDNESDFLLGPYVSGHFTAKLSQRWTALVGAQFQSLGSFEQEAGGKEATLDLEKAIFVYGGVGYSF